MEKSFLAGQADRRGGHQGPELAIKQEAAEPAVKTLLQWFTSEAVV
ncbi:hypothetical protein [Arthrobacter sp. EpRS71]|nr:hypothetical protein [Arthrobacter sp. EpRS71]